MSSRTHQDPRTELYWYETIWNELTAIRRSFGGAPRLTANSPEPSPQSALHWLHLCARELSGIRNAAAQGRVAGPAVMTPALVSRGIDIGPGSEIVIRPYIGSEIVTTGPRLLRVRICDEGSFSDSTNGTVAPAQGCALLQAISASKDIVISDNKGVAASLAVSPAGANNDFKVTAKEVGTGGQSITFRMVAPTGPSAALGVVVSNKAVTVNLATNAGTKQAVARTVSANAAADASGVSITVAAAGFTTTAVTVNVTNGELAASIGGKIRAALSVNAAIAAAFDVSGTGAGFILTRKTAAANDAGFTVTVGAGVTTAADAGNTVAGEALAVSSTAAQVKTAIEGNTVANDLISIAHAAGNNGSGVVAALAVANLAGGIDAEPGVFRLTVANSVGGQNMELRTGQAPIGGKPADHALSLIWSHIVD
jgi:hypothetical protein